MTTLITQNSLLLTKLLEFYNKDGNMEKILPIINGESIISLRLIDWFATNYSKKNYTVYPLKTKRGEKVRTLSNSRTQNIRQRDRDLCTFR